MCVFRGGVMRRFLECVGRRKERGEREIGEHRETGDTSTWERKLEKWRKTPEKLFTRLCLAYACVCSTH